MELPQAPPRPSRTLTGWRTSPNTGFGIGIGLLFFGYGVVILGSLAFMIVALVDIVRRPDWQWKLAHQEKMLWLLLVILVNFLAIPSLIYWFSVRKKLLAVDEQAKAGAFGPGHMGWTGWEPGPGVPVAIPPGVVSGSGRRTPAPMVGRNRVVRPGLGRAGGPHGRNRRPRPGFHRPRRRVATLRSPAQSTMPDSWTIRASISSDSLGLRTRAAEASWTAATCPTARRSSAALPAEWAR